MTLSPTYFIVKLEDPNDFQLRAEIMEFFCNRGVSSQVFSSDVIFGEEVINAKKCGCHKGEGKCSLCSKPVNDTIAFPNASTSSINEFEVCQSIDNDLDLKPEIPLFSRAPTFCTNVSASSAVYQAPSSFSSDPSTLKTEYPGVQQEYLEEIDNVDESSSSSVPVVRLKNVRAVSPQGASKRRRRKKKPTKRGRAVTCSKCGDQLPLAPPLRKSRAILNLKDGDMLKMERHLLYTCSHKADPMEAAASGFYECTECGWKGLTVIEVKRHARTHEEYKKNTFGSWRNLFPEKNEEYFGTRNRLLSLLYAYFPSMGKQCERFYERKYFRTVSRRQDTSYLRPTVSYPPKEVLEKAREWRVSRRSRGEPSTMGPPPKSDDSLKCRLCPRWVSYSRYLIARHVRTHVDVPDRYSCALCPFTHMQDNAVRLHLRSEHDQLPSKTTHSPIDTWSKETKSSFLSMVNECFEDANDLMRDDEDTTFVDLELIRRAAINRRAEVARKAVKCKACKVSLTLHTPDSLTLHVLSHHCRLPTRYCCYSTDKCRVQTDTLWQVLDHARVVHAKSPSMMQRAIKDLWTEEMKSTFTKNMKMCFPGALRRA